MKTEDILGIICETLELDEIAPDARMGHVRGWDSLRHIHLILALESRTSVSIPPDMIGDLVSVPEICSFFRDEGVLTD